MKINFTITNNNPNTIYNVLARKLGRTPTNEEVKQDVLRILREGTAEREAERG